MFYDHEVQERKLNEHPMNITLPPQSICQEHMYEYLAVRNIDEAVTRANGWYESARAVDTFIRIVIPCVTHKAGHKYFQARDTTGKAHLKYQSPKGPRHEALVRMLPLKRAKGTVVVEGAFCAARAAMHGYIAYALMGMMPSQATLLHLCLLIEDNKELPVLVLLDRDSGAAAVKVVTFISSQGYNCRMGTFSKSKDLAELPVKESANLLTRYFDEFSVSGKRMQKQKTIL